MLFRQRLADVIKQKGFMESLTLDAGGTRLKDDEAQKALLEDAIEFAKK